MFQAIFDAIGPTWHGRRNSKKRASDDRRDRLSAAQARFDKAISSQETACIRTDLKIEQSVAITNIARKLLGSEFVCSRLSHYDRHCSGCPWEDDCPLFEANQRARTEQLP